MFRKKVCLLWWQEICPVAFLIFSHLNYFWTIFTLELKSHLIVSWHDFILACLSPKGKHSTDQKRKTGECQLCVFESCLSVPISLWKILCVRVCVCGGGATWAAPDFLWIGRHKKKEKERKKEKGEGRLWLCFGFVWEAYRKPYVQVR